MDTKRTLGIWMDHSTANLIEDNDSISNRIIESEFTHDKKVEALHKNENLMHHKEQQFHEAYYIKIGNEILKYNHVVLFGPTNAKSELRNYLNKDLHFKDIKIDIESADKLTENERSAFVRRYFENH